MKTKAQKRQEANQRNEEWAKLTNKQKLEKLDRMLGVSIGAMKVRARLGVS